VHHIGHAAHYCVAAEFVHTQALGAPGFLQCLQCDIKADLLAELEAIGRRASDADQAQQIAIDDTFLDPLCQYGTRETDDA